MSACIATDKSANDHNRMCGYQLIRHGSLVDCILAWKGAGSHRAWLLLCSSRTAMIATVASSSSQYHHTINTLKYADRVGNTAQKQPSCRVFNSLL